MNSLWHDTARLPYFPPLRGEIKTDVLVIGAGMAGILCAWQLQQSGVSCVVAEADTIASGTTGNTTAKITAQHGLIYHQLLDHLGQEKAKRYLDANLQALSRFRQLAQNIPCDFQEESHTVYEPSDPRILDEELSALEQLGYPAQWDDCRQLPMATAGGIRFPDQARFHPLKFLNALAQELTIYENTPVQGLSGTTAVTDHGKIHARNVIIATHFPFPRFAGGYFMKLYQQRSYVIALNQVPGLSGMYLGARPNSLSLRMQGEQLLLGGGGHRTGKEGGGWAELEQFARIHYPGSTLTHRWAAQDCMSLDQLPYVGQYGPRTPGIFVATGFNKWGMTTSMVAAEVLRDQIWGREHPCSALFSPSRSMIHPQLWVNLGESARNFLSLSPRRCPHLGCRLEWNSQEHSWDCPCHGSRFSESGTLLESPAQKNLKNPL